MRTGEEAAELPIPAGDYIISTVSNSKESATGKWLHATFNHASQVRQDMHGEHWVLQQGSNNLLRQLETASAQHVQLPMPGAKG